MSELEKDFVKGLVDIRLDIGFNIVYFFFSNNCTHAKDN